LGDGWRLPTNVEWWEMAKRYGGIRGDSEDNGRSAYKALREGGSAEFNALLGGGRGFDGQYLRLDAHGFYWSSTESDISHAWFFNFGKGSELLGRHNDGDKPRAFSVRCIADMATSPEK
jgi:uncharacterized protein (TIGR02145 family)